MSSTSMDIFRDMVESTDDLVVRLDHRGRVFYISPSTEKIYGVPPEACMGKKALSFVLPEDRADTMARMSEFIAASVTSGTLENRYEDAEGSIRHMAWSLNFRYGEDGKLQNINAIGRNITPYILMQDDLRKSREVWNKLFMASPNWILLASLGKGHFIDCNDAFCKDTGYTRQEVIGRNSKELGLWSGIEERNRILDLIRNRKRVDRHPFKLRMRDGMVRDFLWSAIVVEVQGEEFVLSVLVDVSELREAQERLAASSRELEEMNSALRVLLRKREEDKTELESKIWHNMKKLVEPHIYDLRHSGLNHTQTAHLDVIASRLDEITSDLGRKLGHHAHGLTPRELEIAGLILEGKSNKSIAEILNISIYSVHSHRQGIRKKLGLLGSRENLRSHLGRLSQ